MRVLITMTHRCTRLLSLPVVLSLLALAGCGGGTNPVEVSGKLIMPPNLKLVESDVVVLTFLPEETPEKAVTAEVIPKEGSFTTKQILPGKHVITVVVQPYPGMPDSERRMTAFEGFNNSFTRENKKLTYEVTKDAQQSITIDLPKAKVTKG
jgi:hypothetical protein